MCVNRNMSLKGETEKNIKLKSCVLAHGDNFHHCMDICDMLIENNFYAFEKNLWCLR